MSVNFVMRAIPEDCELMQQALADEPGLRDALEEFMFEAHAWRFNEPVLRFRDTHRELVDLYLDAGTYRYGDARKLLLRMVEPPLTARHEEVAKLIDTGTRYLFNDPPRHPALLPASRVSEVVGFLDTLDPARDDNDFADLLADLQAFYRRVAAVPGLAVVVATI